MRFLNACGNPEASPKSLPQRTRIEASEGLQLSLFVHATLSSHLLRAVWTALSFSAWEELKLASNSVVSRRMPRNRNMIILKGPSSFSLAITWDI